MSQSQHDQIEPKPVRDADPQQLRQWIESGEVVLIDVREADEFAREHIAAAHSIPLSRFSPSQVRERVSPGQRIVFQCKSGRRSADACRLAAPLAEAGHQITNLAGGIEAWKSASLPLIVDARSSSLSVMRQVQLTIGAGVLLGSALAWLISPWFLIVPAFFGAGLVFAGASGTCGLASLLAVAPWNRTAQGSPTCGTGGCC